MQNVINNVSNNDKFWTIGWKLSSKSDKPDFYMIFIPGDKDIPLMDDGKVLLFTDQTLVEYFTEKYRSRTNQNIEIDLVCDIDQAMLIINKRLVDNNSIVLNVLNFLLDASHEIKIPNKSKKILYSLADHLTFSKRISVFYIEKYEKKLVLESIYILLGIVMANSTFWSKK